MLRPIESNLSLYSVDHKAHQAQNDPNAHQFQAMQQEEIVKRTTQQMNTVQKSPESEGEVKIRDRDPERERGGQKKKKKREGGAELSQEEEKSGNGHLDFLA
jgi:hypothetical protein